MTYPLLQCNILWDPVAVIQLILQNLPTNPPPMYSAAIPMINTPKTKCTEPNFA